MAALQSYSAIEALPAPLKKQVVDRLVAGQSSRKVSAFIKSKGHDVSFSAVARYNRLTIKPALRMSFKLRKHDRIEGDCQTVVDENRAIAAATTEALAAKPIISRAEWIWKEVEEGVAETKAGWVEDPQTKEIILRPADVKARASMLAQANKTLENYGRAIGDPNFSPVVAASPSTENRVIIVMPMANDSRLMAWQARQREAEAAETIEVEAK